MATTAEPCGIPEIDDDPVVRLIWAGEAKDLHEAEAIYLERSMPEILRLLATDLSDEELLAHPLFRLLRAHGSWGYEDSLA